MNTVVGVCQLRGCNYVRLSLPDTVCSLATCHGDRAKVGSHLNIPEKLNKKIKIKKEREREAQVFGAIAEVAFSEPEGDIRTPLKVTEHTAPSSFYRQHVGNAHMTVGRLYNYRVPLIKQNTCFGHSAHSAPTILI